ncbi:MAG: divergent PAP2 family protein [Clostridia bacterium]|nr:divergent PAP2 family protein [Clostridia bacterium]
MVAILDNVAIWVPFFTWCTVQILKFIFDLISHKKVNFRRLYGSGGMPSSHSATVMSLTTVAGIVEGFDSIAFAACFVFSLIVMYDAAGVRRAAGKQARVLNQIIANRKDINIQEKLVELLGHTPIEVFVGAIFGVVEAVALYNVFWK